MKSNVKDTRLGEVLNLHVPDEDDPIPTEWDMYRRMTFSDLAELYRHMRESAAQLEERDEEDSYEVYRKRSRYGRWIWSRSTTVALLMQYVAHHGGEIPAWEELTEEDRGRVKADARIRHKDNKPWVIDTYNELCGDYDDDRPAYKAVQTAYLKEFKKSIHISTIRSYLGHK